MSRLTHTIYLGIIGVLAATIVCLIIEPLNDAQADPGTIAVLPFVAMGRENSEVRLTDSITTSIEHALSQESGLRVSPRSDVVVAIAGSGRDFSIGAVGEALGVARVLEGSVRVQGDRIRVTAQVIEASTDKHLWSETYDRNIEDVDAIVTEIANKVANLQVGPNTG